jgi:hypothetical protein
MRLARIMLAARETEIATVVDTIGTLDITVTSMSLIIATGTAMRAMLILTVPPLLPNLPKALVTIIGAAATTTIITRMMQSGELEIGHHRRKHSTGSMIGETHHHEMLATCPIMPKMFRIKAQTELVMHLPTRKHWFLSHRAARKARLLTSPTKPLQRQKLTAAEKGTLCRAQMSRTGRASLWKAPLNPARTVLSSRA